MRSSQEYEQAMELVSRGLNDSEIARATGIPRATVREWRIGEGYRHREGEAGRAGIDCDGSCSAVEQQAVGRARTYAHLFGLYLGDGTISDQRRGVTRLRVFLDEKYPRIIEGCVRSMSTIRGSDRIGLTTHPGCIEVGSSWKHWKCVFPQAGPGMKHTRHIALERWQQRIVDGHPEEFLRGLYESDGSRHINPITRRLPTGIRHYRYSRYMFSNESADIQRLFKETCDALGVHWTQASRKNIAVSRREDVAFLDEFLGPKE
ncbi:MAG: helix-turn-helix domain-containing protein [Acidimicrobiia bacterium]